MQSTAEPLVENDFSSSVDTNRFRRARFSVFLKLVGAAAANGRTVRILDIGGTQAYWQGLRPLWGNLPLEITLINLGAPEYEVPPYISRAGDACDLSQFPDMAFDIVHSNSVIEHVGQWTQTCAMAKEVRRLAPHYFVQTPNLWFPMEPHYRTLFFALYPASVRAQMLTRRRRGFRGPFQEFSEAMMDVETVNLLDARGMRQLFPDGRLVRERFFGLTKSLTMVR